MDTDEPTNETRPAPPASALSKTPSWIMLGFILGAGFVAALPPWKPPPPAEAGPVPAPAPAAPIPRREPTPISTIEAVFTEWQRHAVWADDTTEVALWNAADRAFSDCYEVRRSGDAFYFRTISKLTRRIISRGRPMPGSPLQFTETEEQYREWLEHGRTERPVTFDLRPRAPDVPAGSALRVEPPAPAEVPPKFEVPKADPGVIR